MKHFISLEKAKTMTALYRKERGNVVTPEHAQKGTLSLSETFDAEPFRVILSKPDCTGLRIYYGMDDTHKIHAIIVGVNAKNEDILPVENTIGVVGAVTVNDTIIEDSYFCPPVCPVTSPLNS